MMMTVQEIANLTGVSVRTLQYYDKISLLAPADYTEAGYRLYDNEKLIALHQILLYKELGFSLKAVRELLNDPSSDKNSRLLEQKILLIEKRNNLEDMITQVDALLRGETKMDFEVFKNTLASRMPKETSSEDKEKILEHFTPEMFQTIENAWGTKDFLELPQNTTFEALMENLKKAHLLLKQVFETDLQKEKLQLIGEWVKLSVEAYTLKDEATFISSMISDYQNSPKVIEATNEQYGAGANEKLLDLLKTYSETL